MRKPILMLYIVIVASIATALYASKTSLSLDFTSLNIGSHPKSVPDAVTCPDGLILKPKLSCDTIVIVNTPTSNCTISYMDYSFNGGPVVVITPVGGVYPPTINLGTQGIGTYSIVWNVRDNCIPPATAVCNVTIIILDETPPTIVCPDDVSVGNLDDGRNTLVTVGQPTVDDNCGILSVINNYNMTDDATDDYPLGTTVVCWTVTDLSNNTASCCMSVIVFDNTPPELTCPDTIRTQCVAPLPYQYWSQFIAAGGTATDDVMIDTSSFMWLIDSLYTGICPQKIARKYKIADNSGNMDTCRQIIFINDTIAPTAICKNITVFVPQSGMITIAASELNDNSTDNCSDPLTFSTNIPLLFGCNDAITMVPIPVILTVTDKCGNSSTCTSIVTVLDNIPPTITCPPLVTVNANNGECFSNNVILGTPTTNDNCGVSSVVATYNNINIQGTTQIPVGTNTVVWIVTDVKGNTATCAQTVTVIDNQNPTITCPANFSVNTNPGVCFASNFTIPTAIVNDNCGIQSTVVTLGGSPITSATQFPRGMNTITYTVTDVNGRTASCTATVTVVDNQNPMITCPINLTINNTTANCFVTGVNLDTPVTSDNCGVATSVATLNNIVVTSTTQFPVGTNTVIWTVTDINGRTATCAQTITIVDMMNPTITCTSTQNITVNTNPNVCFASNVPLIIPPTSDNCGILSVVPTWNGNIVTNTTQFPTGVSTIVWTVTDVNGLTASCTTTITVVDNQAPTIICPATITVSTNPNVCYATGISIPVATTSDNCGVQNTVVTFGGNPILSTTQFPTGNNTITYSVTDINGLTTSCTATIVVVDNQRPTITCPSNITLSNEAGKCYNSSVVLGLPTTRDNCGVTSVVPRLGTNVVTSSTQFPVGVNTVIFTVADAQGNTATCPMTVTINDTERPTITCPAQQEVMLDNNCSLVMPNLTSTAIATDNCTGFVVTQSPLAGTILSSADGMIHTITFTVTDASGLNSSCATTVIAKDRLGPDIVCKNSDIISLSVSPELPASWFVTSATDNCGGPITYQARRMGNDCGSNVPDNLGPYVNFCCEDAGKTVNIVVEVSDSRGNTSTCMIAIQVQDKLKPFITHPLPDLNISCDYQLDITDLSIFGTYVLNRSTRNNIVLNDPGKPGYPTPVIVGQDGVYTKNCPGAIVTVTSRKDLTMCNVGTIYRDFVITDASGNSTTTTQTITVTDTRPFTELDIIWPDANVDFPDCNNTNPPTSITGAPILNDDRCSVVAATFKDQVFTNPNVCGFIKRTWTVLDWCQYVKNSGSNTGKWTFEQYINFTDKIAPVIGSKTCRDTIICTPQSACVATTTFTAAGTDNCLPSNVLWSYKIDINNNGGTPEFTGTGNTITRTYAIGTHRLTWEAKDKCGNTSTCSMLFTIRDCKAPTLYVFNGLATNLNPPMAMSEIWASDYNNGSSDNCTPTSQLRYSFSPDVNDTRRVFTCADLGIKPLTVYVTDLAGNQTAVNTFMNVQDQNGLCSGNKPVQINGEIYTEAKIAIPGTEILLDSGEDSSTFMTKEEGDYHFENLPMYRDYNLQPIKDSNPLDGVTTLDLVMIQRHILGVELLKSPYQIIAADINNSQSLTAGDLSELRKLILGVQTKFSKNTSWRFVDAAYKFNDAKHPWPFSELINYQGLQNDMMASDFIGVKIGDINGDAIEEFGNEVALRSRKNLKLYTDDISVNANVEVKIPILSQDLDRTIAIQGTITLADHVQYIGVEGAGLTIRNEHVATITKEEKQYLTLAFDTAEPMRTNKDEVLYYIIVKAKRPTRVSQMISLNSDVTPALVYDDELNKSSLTLEFRTVTSANPSVVLQNQPNPFSSETSIPLTLSQASAVTITVYDQEGAQIYRGVENFEVGSHSIKLSDKQLGNHYGVLFCKVKSKEVNEVIKILRLE